MWWMRGCGELDEERVAAECEDWGVVSWSLAYEASAVGQDHLEAV